MPKKKTPRKIGNFLRKPKPARRSTTFPCPNTGDPLTVHEIVVRMQFDSDFAEFISRLLCASYSDEKAKAFLEQLSVYQRAVSRRNGSTFFPGNAHDTYPPPNRPRSADDIVGKRWCQACRIRNRHVPWPSPADVYAPQIPCLRRVAAPMHVVCDLCNSQVW